MPVPPSARVANSHPSILRTFIRSPFPQLLPGGMRDPEGKSFIAAVTVDRRCHCCSCRLWSARTRHINQDLVRRWPAPRRVAALVVQLRVPCSVCGQCRVSVRHVTSLSRSIIYEIEILIFTQCCCIQSQCCTREFTEIRYGTSTQSPHQLLLLRSITQLHPMH